MISLTRSLLASAGLLAFILPGASQAAYTTFARAQTGLDQIGPGFVPSDAAQQSNTGSPSFASAATIDQVVDPDRPSGWLYRRQSLGQASASAGILKASATAGFFVDGFQTGSWIEASSTAVFNDVLTVRRSGAGQATVRLSFVVSGSLFSAPNFAYALGQLDAFGSPLINFQNRTSLGAGDYTCSDGGSPSPCLGFVDLNLPTNTQIDLRGSLSVYARATGQLGRGESSALYGNTGYVYLSSADPEVQLSTQSGFAYLAPVPEPGSWASLLAGLAALGAVVRQRRRQGV